MKTLMRNGRDRRSENPFLGHARKERVSLFGTDQRITSGPAATRLHSKAEYMTAPERFADSQIPLAPRAPSIHDPELKSQPFARSWEEALQITLECINGFGRNPEIGIAASWFLQAEYEQHCRLAHFLEFQWRDRSHYTTLPRRDLHIMRAADLGRHLRGRGAR